MNLLKEIRIELPLSELTHRKEVVVDECFLILSENFIDYKVVGTYSSDQNEEGIWKEYTTNYRWNRKRDSISDLNMFFDNREKLWTVDIEFIGIANSIDWHWTKPKEALVIYEKLKAYRKLTWKDFLETYKEPVSL